MSTVRQLYVNLWVLLPAGDAVGGFADLIGVHVRTALFGDHFALFGAASNHSVAAYGVGVVPVKDDVDAPVGSAGDPQADIFAVVVGDGVGASSADGADRKSADLVGDGGDVARATCDSASEQFVGVHGSHFFVPS